MFQNDYILREIEMLSRFLAKVLFQKEAETEEILNEDNLVSATRLFRHMLFRMLSEGRINEAENLLHETVEAEPQTDYLRIALDFYKHLASMTDEELEAADFSREEVAEGLNTIKSYYIAF